MYDYPPMLTGDALQQIASLRDYLVRQARGIDKQVREITEKEISIVREDRAKKPATATKDQQEMAASLRSLIVKTADTVESHVDAIYAELNSSYLAISDEFGTYQENIDARITAMASGIEAQFNATEEILTPMAQYTTELSGTIRLGIIEEPNSSPLVRAVGIVIGQNLQFTSVTEEIDGKTYTHLGEGQTVGIYTSTGWQFWINGHKMGWFDSQNSALHVGNLTVENNLQMGDDWLITTTGGFGIRKL